MESMVSMFSDCEYCNPNGQTKTQQTQNTAETSQPEQKAKQSATAQPSQATKPNETPKPNTQASQREKQPEKVKNICSFCPTDEEIEQENSNIQKNYKLYLQKLKIEKQEWKKDTLEFERYKQEIKNKPLETNWFYKLTPNFILENNLSLSLYKHYAERSGENLTIDEIYIVNDLKSFINKRSTTFIRGRIRTRIKFNIKSHTTHSVQERFLKDIVTGNIYFNNTYDMKREVAFAIGRATLRGIFYGSIKRIKECKRSLDCQKKKYLVQGNITYYFRDEFKDPEDTFNLTPEIVDIDGVLFAITGEFNVSINGMYYENGVEVTRGF